MKKYQNKIELSLANLKKDKYETVQKLKRLSRFVGVRCEFFIQLSHSPSCGELSKIEKSSRRKVGFFP